MNVLSDTISSIISQITPSLVCLVPRSAVKYVLIIYVKVALTSTILKDFKDCRTDSFILVLPFIS